MARCFSTRLRMRRRIEKHGAVVRERVERGRDARRAAIRANAIGAQRIDRDQNDVARRRRRNARCI